MLNNVTSHQEKRNRWTLSICIPKSGGGGEKDLNQIKSLCQGSRSNYQFSGNKRGKMYVKDTMRKQLEKSRIPETLQDKLLACLSKLLRG